MPPTVSAIKVATEAKVITGRRNLFRMRQFFDAYRGHKKVSPLPTQLPWTHHLTILNQTKTVFAAGKRTPAVAISRAETARHEARSKTAAFATSGVANRAFPHGDEHG